ncbi:MAG: PilZ domain-containing protein [Xanthobacteraceae bacterium]
MSPKRLARQELTSQDAVPERRREPRIVARIPGRYSLTDVRDARGERCVFACRAVNLSPRSVAVAAPVIGKLGERIIADILHLGRLEGPITRLFDRGFAMDIEASEEERANLAGKIEWLARHKDDQLPDRRSNQRFAPISPHSRLVMPDGTCMNCFVIDISISGAAISAKDVPEVGTVLAVGKVVSRVQRHFVGGFSVRFIEPQSRERVEAMVIQE